MMFKWIGGTGSLIGLLALIGLFSPVSTHAQGAQQNETDLAFIKRMTTRLQNVERQAERLEEYIRELSKQAIQNDFMGQDQFGRQSSGSVQDRQGELRRAEMQMRSTRKRAGKERDELVELQRAGSSVSAEQREKIEKIVSGLERKATNMERDIRQRRL